MTKPEAFAISWSSSSADFARMYSTIAVPNAMRSVRGARWIACHSGMRMSASPCSRRYGRRSPAPLLSVMAHQVTLATAVRPRTIASNPVLDPHNVAADAGEQAGANQRDRQPVPDQPDIVGGEMIEGGPESGQEQSDQEQPVAGPSGAQMVAGAPGPQGQPAPDRDQGEACVGKHIGGVRDAERGRLVGEFMVMRRLRDASVQRQDHDHADGDDRRRVLDPWGHGAALAERDIHCGGGLHGSALIS